MRLAQIPRDTNHIYQAEDLIGIDHIKLRLDLMTTMRLCDSLRGIYLRAYLDQVNVLTYSTIHFLAKYRIPFYETVTYACPSFCLVPRPLDDKKYGFQLVNLPSPLPIDTTQNAIGALLLATNEEMFKDGFPLFEQFLASLIFTN
jgi:hypothetical protein